MATFTRPHLDDRQRAILDRSRAAAATAFRALRAEQAETAKAFRVLRLRHGVSTKRGRTS